MKKKEQDKNIIYNNCSAFCCSHIAFVRPSGSGPFRRNNSGRGTICHCYSAIYLFHGGRRHTHTRSERKKNRVEKSLEMKCETMIPVLNPKLGKECIACWGRIMGPVGPQEGQYLLLISFVISNDNLLAFWSFGV